MSKSRKKQRARAQAQEAVTVAPEEATEAPELPEVPAPRSLELDEAVFERVVEAVTRAGVMREEGDRLAYVYNGPELSMKYVEASDEAPATLLVAAFQAGIVYQVREGAQITYRPGAWEHEIDKLAELDGAGAMEPDEPTA